ncbi:MAG: type II toxin-antitoxin system RelE/ParE family toxin [Burkholderiales bacterium]|nr:type II toxin-antitoxin system RelE/ParE family toxin [Burkholderiales bacterium]
MRLVLSRFVEGDLDAIAAYIAQDNPRRAVTFIEDIRTKFRDIHRSPLMYRLRPDIGEQARTATVGNYAILFRVVGELIRIERVTYGGRDLPAMFNLS